VLNVRFRISLLPALPAIIVAAVMLAGCAGGPRYFLAEQENFAPGSAVAVLPPVNYSRNQTAPDLVVDGLVLEILRLERLRPVDPGEVEKVILAKRIRLTDRMPSETLSEIGRLLNAKYILTGSINQFDYVTVRNESFPVISLSLRMIDADEGEVVWAATCTRRGDDSETVFGLGRVKTLERMCGIVTREMIETLKE